MIVEGASSAGKQDVASRSKPRLYVEILLMTRNRGSGARNERDRQTCRVSHPTGLRFFGYVTQACRGCYETLDVAVQNEKMQAGARITGWLISKV